jgi:hypothetical protein
LDSVRKTWVPVKSKDNAAEAGVLRRAPEYAILWLSLNSALLHCRTLYKPAEMDLCLAIVLLGCPPETMLRVDCRVFYREVLL